MADKILTTGPLLPIAEEILEPFGKIEQSPDIQEDTLAEMLKDSVVGLVVRGEAYVTPRILETAAHLKVIGRSGVGYDTVDIAAATARSIPVVNTPGANARAVAEASMAFMFALVKNIGYWDQQVKNDNWYSRYGLANGDLDGQALGIVGLGNIGQTLARMAQPFNMTIRAYDPYVDKSKATELGVSLVSLEELMSQSNFICLHAALTDTSRGLIDRQALQHVQPGCYLVNLARGEVVESLDILEEALEDGRLAGVALDVFAPEPPSAGHPIFKRENCFTSPHAMAMSKRAMERVFESMATDMAAVLKGERPRFVVNPEVLG